MRLVILDRDGVINAEREDFVKSPKEWQPIPGSLEAIARLNRAGYRVVVITNQSGIGRGLFTLEDLCAIHEKMHYCARRVGGRIDAVFFCPHAPEAGCSCRKPRPGLFLELAKRLGVRLGGVPAIGDSLRDVEAAQAAGAFPILVRSGKPLPPELPPGVPVYADLAQAVDALLG